MSPEEEAGEQRMGCKRVAAAGTRNRSCQQSEFVAVPACHQPEQKGTSGECAFGSTLGPFEQ